ARLAGVEDGDAHGTRRQVLERRLHAPLPEQPGLPRLEKAADRADVVGLSVCRRGLDGTALAGVSRHRESGLRLLLPTLSGRIPQAVPGRGGVARYSSCRLAAQPAAKPRALEKVAGVPPCQPDRLSERSGQRQGRYPRIGPARQSLSLDAGALG